MREKKLISWFISLIFQRESKALIKDKRTKGLCPALPLSFRLFVLSMASISLFVLTWDGGLFTTAEHRIRNNSLE